MAVNPAVAADGTLVAASGTGAAGDNTAAKAIAALQNARVVNGSATFVDSWSQLVYQVGTDAQTATSNQTNAQAVVTAVQQIRDSLSGVSLDQEATNLMIYQKAYQANAKYFTTVNSALNTLMGMVGVTY
jgi:flagellar hook-associated protein 1 FlgK